MSETTDRLFARVLPGVLVRRPHLAGYLGGCLQFELTRRAGPPDIWCLDCREPGAWNLERRADPRADATLRIPVDTFESLLAAPMPAWADAYARGQIEVEGNLLTVVALKGFFDEFGATRLARLALRWLGPRRALALAAGRLG
jgi:hypothetical protein